jgi:hypothetical protein
MPTKLDGPRMVSAGFDDEAFLQRQEASRKARRERIEKRKEGRPTKKERITAKQEIESGTIEERVDVARRIAELRSEIGHADKPSAKGIGIDAELLGDFDAGVLVAENRMRLDAEASQALARELSSFAETTRDSKVATNKGYPVAAVYDAQVQGWTTQSRIVTLPDGQRLFALTSYPQGKRRRHLDRLMERLSGDPMRKPKPKDWKRIVESRNSIPTVEGTPENMVVMPFIESMNAYDLFAHQKEIKDFGPFSWAEGMSADDRLDLAPGIAEELSRVHGSGRTWGEAILPNVVLTKERKSIYIDPETTYEGIEETEQRATDVRNLITSICGALARSEGVQDFKRIAGRVLDGYRATETIAALREICAKPLTFRNRLFFNIFSRFRVGSTDLNEFNRVREAIVQAIDERG